MVSTEVRTQGHNLARRLSSRRFTKRSLQKETKKVLKDAQQASPLYRLIEHL